MSGKEPSAPSPAHPAGRPDPGGDSQNAPDDYAVAVRACLRVFARAAVGRLCVCRLVLVGGPSGGSAGSRRGGGRGGLVDAGAGWGRLFGSLWSEGRRAVPPGPPGCGVLVRAGTPRTPLSGRSAE